MPKPVLVILSPGFAANEADSTCLPLQQALVNAIKEKFPDIDIVVVAFQYPFISSVYQWNYTKIISLNGRNKGKLRRVLLWRKAWKCLTQLHKHGSIIGILSFWYGECAFIGNRFAKKHSLKHYCWIMGQDAKRGNKYVNYTKLKDRQIIALSDFLQNEFHRNYGVKPYIIIPAGVKVDLAPLSERDIDLLAVGSLIPLKQFNLFIETVAEIKKQLPDVKAVLIGDGSEKKNLICLARNLGAKENIIFTGLLPHPEVLSLMGKTKILLHTSSYEGFGVVCLEALSKGAHVISFVQPMKEKIEQWQFVNTKEEMLQKSIEMLNNVSTVFNNTIFQSIEEVAQKIVKLFLESN